MTSDAFVSELARRLNITKKDAGKILKNIVEILGEFLFAKKKIRLTHIGSLEAIERSPSRRRNPQTGNFFIQPKMLRVKLNIFKNFSKRLNY